MSSQARSLARLVSTLALGALLSACGGGSPANTSAPAAAPTAAAAGVLASPVAPAPAATAAPAAAVSEAAATAAPAAAVSEAAATAAPAAPPAAPMQAATQGTVAETVDAPTPIVELPAPTRAPQDVAVNPFTRTSDDHLSTFGMDVDTASYTAARNYLTSGQMPPADTVRAEEFVNYFHYDYPAPREGTFGIAVDGTRSPFGREGQQTQVVRVGIQGKRIDDSQRQDAVLTFVIDASGSMDRPNRLPLVKQGLKLLVNQLRENDKVAIVVFGSQSHIVLTPTSAAQKDILNQAIDSLGIEGATDIEAGLRMAYELASNNFKTGAINRVILCTDGEANVGATSPDAILQTIHDYAAQGVLLSTVGFGLGDYNDRMLQTLADKGNGNYSYVDTLQQAQRIFVENLTGTLQVIAKDAKIQVDFNPAVVSSYRLLGYEKRDVADADFRNDRVDAGEVGAGHSVTALYEVVLTGQGSGTALTVHIRYADPKTNEVREEQQPFDSNAITSDFASAPLRLQQAVAVAGFAEQLRGSAYAQGRSLDDILQITQRIAPQLANDQDVQEFVQLVQRAKQIQR